MEYDSDAAQCALCTVKGNEILLKNKIQAVFPVIVCTELPVLSYEVCFVRFCGFFRLYFETCTSALSQPHCAQTTARGASSLVSESELGTAGSSSRSLSCCRFHVCARRRFGCPAARKALVIDQLPMVALGTHKKVTLVAEPARVRGCAVGFCGAAFAPLWEVGFGGGTDISYLLVFNRKNMVMSSLELTCDLFNASVWVCFVSKELLFFSVFLFNYL